MSYRLMKPETIIILSTGNHLHILQKNHFHYFRQSNVYFMSVLFYLAVTDWMFVAPKLLGWNHKSQCGSVRREGFRETLGHEDQAWVTKTHAFLRREARDMIFSWSCEANEKMESVEQGEGSHHMQCWIHLHPDFPDSKTVRKQHLLFKSPSDSIWS